MLLAHAEAKNWQFQEHAGCINFIRHQVGIVREDVRNLGTHCQVLGVLKHQAIGQKEVKDIGWQHSYLHYYKGASPRFFSEARDITIM